jgi:hypothetical protein
VTSPASTLALPSGGDLLIYDGDCGFCRWTLDLGRTWLAEFPLAVPSQRLDLPALGLTVAAADRAVHLRTASGRLLAGHRAAGMVLLGQAGFRWRLLGALLITPPFSWLAACAYRLIARYRGRLFKLVTAVAWDRNDLTSAVLACST